MDQHVGPPLDREADETIKQFIADAIELSPETITIHPSTLGGPAAAARPGEAPGQPVKIELARLDKH